MLGKIKDHLFSVIAKMKAPSEAVLAKEWSAQPSTFTVSGRNDRTFEELAHHLIALGNRPAKFLSFGCSEGFEALDAKRLLPTAEIFGCDVNAEALNTASKQCAGTGITIFSSSRNAILKHGPYDAIVAMNVLVRYPDMYGIDDLIEIYPFSAFDETITTMVDALNVGGYLAIYNSCYLVEQSSAAHRLQKINQALPKQNGWVDKYDNESRRIAVATDKQGVPITIKAWRKYMYNNSHIGAIKNAYFVVKDGKKADFKTIIWQKTA